MQPLKGGLRRGNRKETETDLGCGRLAEKLRSPPQSSGSTSATSWREWRERNRLHNYLNLGNYDPLCGVCGIVGKRPGGVN